MYCATNSCPSAFLALLIPIAIIACVIFLVYFFDPMGQRMKSMGGRRKSNGRGVITVDGREVELYYFGGSKNSSPFLSFTVKGTFGSSMLIRSETTADDRLKRIGFNKEIQLSDTTIDPRLYFECDEPEFVRRMFYKDDAKNILKDIFDHASSIEISPGACAIKIRPCASLAKISDELIIFISRKLLSLVSFIPPVIVSPNPDLVKFKSSSLFLIVSGYAILALGIASVVWANVAFLVADTGRFWLASMCVVFVGIAVVSFWVFNKIKGFSTSSRVFWNFMLPFCVGMILLGRFGGAVINGYLDMSQAKQFDVPVVDKYITRDRSSTYYHVVVAPWRSQTPGVRFAVNRNAYNSVHPGKTRCAVTVKKGFLDFEWVVHKKFIN